MTGMGFIEWLVLAIMFVPVVVLIIGVVAFPIIISTLFIRHKVLQHHH